MAEYKIIEVKLAKAEDKMNEMLKEGWKVVSTTLYQGGANLTKGSTLMLITFSKNID